MKVLILNSGFGSRMGDLTKEHPKCMTELGDNETIISRQLSILSELGLNEVIITTGYFDSVLVDYCRSLGYDLELSFVKNPIYDQTNYIYSIYCARELLLNEDVILMHGDLVFDKSVLSDMLAFKHSCMKVSSTLPLPEKDFKAVINNGFVEKVGVEFFDNAMEAQALYKLNKAEWQLWLDKIIEFCEADKRKCYAEVALNQIAEECKIYAYDVKDRLCAEIDNPDDLEKVKSALTIN